MKHHIYHTSSEMEMSSRDWTQQYESLKKRIQNQRINGAGFTSEEIRLIEKQIGVLESQLKAMSGNALQYELVASEIARRETLLANIKTLTQALFSRAGAPNAASGTGGVKAKSPYNSTVGAGGQLQTQADIMKQQDLMVADIGYGVSRLHEKAVVIGEEAKSHVRLLDDLDSNVEIATAALQAEAKHAAEIQEKGKVCYMYICIGIEIAVLLLLIILAFS